VGRLLPIVRTFISFPAGVARMRISTFIIFSTAGAFLWSCLLVYAGTVLGANWEQIRHALQPFDLLIAVLGVGAVLLFIWWRMGTPGRPGRPKGEAAT
jgi:membrane protein DedA with SNARE-associated domain